MEDRPIPKKIPIPRITKCGECGKEIHLAYYIASEYAYKVRTGATTLTYFCNWNCMRKYQREHGLLPEQQGATKGDRFCKTYDEKLMKKKEQRKQEKANGK